MSPEDYPEFRKTWLACYELTSWKAEKPSQAAMALAFEALAPVMSLDEYVQAIKTHMTDPVAGKHPPTIAGLLQAGDSQTADEAFEEVIHALKTVGPYRTPDFADPRTAGAVTALGGWQRLNIMTHDELKRRIPEFTAAYQAGVRPNAKALRGLVQEHNEEHLLARKPELIERFAHEVVTIGDDDNDAPRRIAG